MKKKKLLITYKQLEGMRNGRNDFENMVVYAGDHNCFPYIYLADGDIQSRNHANKIAEAQLEETLKELKKYDEAFIYFGFSGRSTSISTIERFVAFGIKVNVVACGCRWSEKLQMADKLSVPLIKSWCGGFEVFHDLIQRFSYSSKI